MTLASNFVMGALLEALMGKGVLSVAELRALLRVAGETAIEQSDTPEGNEAMRIIASIIDAFPPEGH